MCSRSIVCLTLPESENIQEKDPEGWIGVHHATKSWEEHQAVPAPLQDGEKLGAAGMRAMWEQEGCGRRLGTEL